MDPLVWGDMPPHLLERVLAFLSVEDLLRMRRVCTSWRRDILSVPSFRALHKEVSPAQHPWFIASSSKRRFLAYDASTEKWNLLSVASLPGNLPDPDLMALASSHGLVCFGFRWGELTSTEHLYVCNPITGSSRRLPPHPEKTVDHFGMYVSPSTNSYKLLTINAAARSLTLYDSASERWTPGTPLHSNLHLSRCPMAWCGEERAFFMDRIQPWSELHYYNLPTSSWHSLKATSPQVFDSPSLVACNRRLFMVGVHNIWELVLRPAGFEFALFESAVSAQLPKELTEKKTVQGRRASVNQFRLSAVGSGRFVWLSSNLDHSWVLVYDTESRTFHNSPKYSKLPVHLSEFVELPFHPCLHATPSIAQ